MDFFGHEIDCDINATNIYRDIYNVQCDCTECENFRQLFKINYPSQVLLLEQFGINICFPLEIMDLGTDDKNIKREYAVFYAVKGSLPTDKIIINYNNTTITLRNSNISKESYSNTGMEKPYFIIEVADVFLAN